MYNTFPQCVSEPQTHVHPANSDDVLITTAMICSIKSALQCCKADFGKMIVVVVQQLQSFYQPFPRKTWTTPPTRKRSDILSSLSPSLPTISLLLLLWTSASSLFVFKLFTSPQSLPPCSLWSTSGPSHNPYISKPTHCHPFIAHDHAIVTY